MPGEGLVAVGADGGQLAVVEVHDLPGVSDQCGRVAGDVHLPVADAQDDRAPIAGDDDPIRMVSGGDRDAVRPLHLVECSEHCVLEGSVAGAGDGATVRVACSVTGGQRRDGPGDEMGEDLGVGLGGELDPVGLEDRTQGRGVVDDAVVYDRHPAVLAYVRVGVLRRGCAVGGPAGVSDAELAREPFRQRRLEIPDPSSVAVYA